MRDVMIRNHGLRWRSAAQPPIDDEPDVALTDYAVAAECALLTGLLFRGMRGGERFAPLSSRSSSPRPGLRRSPAHRVSFF